MRTKQTNYNSRNYVTCIGTLKEIEEKVTDLYEQYDHVTIEDMEGLFTFNETLIANIVCY